MRDGIVNVGRDATGNTRKSDTPLMKAMKEKLKERLHVEELDEETIQMVERMIILRVSTKHVNLWMRQLEVKRKEITEPAWLMGFDVVKLEIEKEKNIDRWAKRCSNQFKKRQRGCYSKYVTTMRGVVN